MAIYIAGHSPRRDIVSQHMRAYALDDPGIARGFLESARQHRFVQMIPADHAALGIERTAFRRKHVLPAPLIAGARILARERVGQMHLAVSLAQIDRMQTLRRAKLRVQHLHQALGQHRHPVLGALCVRETYVAPRAQHRGYGAFYSS